MLRRLAITATLWSGADVFLRQLLQLFVSIALARLVAPDAFGTIALLSFFVAIASAFVDSGLSSALIQAQDATHRDESTVFWFNVASGAVVALILCAAAPAIAGLFGLPVLVPLTILMALNVLLNAFGSVQATLLRKRLAFRAQMKVSVIATVAAGSVAVVMAVRGYGVWALAAQAIVMSGVSTLLLWVLVGWRPARVFDVKSAKRLLRFGGYLLLSALLDGAYTRGYAALIGKVHGVGALGQYYRAEGTQQLPVGLLTLILSRVAFPIFSQAAQDPSRLRRGVRLSVRGVMLVNVPMMMGLMVLAEPLVLALFGAAWLPAVPPLRVLALSGLLWPMHVINLNVLMAQGHADLFFRLELVKKALGTALLVVGACFGVMGIAWSQVALGVLGFFINAHYTHRNLGYGAFAQLKDFAPVMLPGLLMAALVHAASVSLSVQPLVELLALSGLGAVLFFVAGWILRLSALRDALELLRSMSAPR